MTAITSLKHPRTRERVERCAQLVQEGKKRREIVTLLSAEWGLSVRRVDDYLQAAYKIIADEAASQRASEVGRSLARLNHLYERALETNNLRAALGAVREINAMLGLHAPARLQLDAHVSLDWRAAVEQAWQEAQREHSVALLD
jgi:hypothetical protein